MFCVNKLFCRFLGLLHDFNMDSDNGTPNGKVKPCSCLDICRRSPTETKWITREHKPRPGFGEGVSKECRRSPCYLCAKAPFNPGKNQNSHKLFPELNHLKILALGCLQLCNNRRCSALGTAALFHLAIKREHWWKASHGFPRPWYQCGGMWWFTWGAFDPRKPSLCLFFLCSVI